LLKLLSQEFFISSIIKAFYTMSRQKQTAVVWFFIIGFVFSVNAMAQPSDVSNPIIRGYYADPTIVVDSNNFYIYATIDPWGGDSLALWQSNNFITWKYVPLNWPTKAQCTSATSNDSRVWAPSVIKGKDNLYHMFVSVGSEVYAGVSESPGGPWKNVKPGGGPFIQTQKNINVHTIDAEVFLDDDGKAYLYWGSGWNWKDGHCFMGKLNAAMDGFIEAPKDITPPHYFEGPYMLKRKGVYYLMYSDGKCTDSSYKVRYSTALDPAGPWKEGKNSPVLSTDMQSNVVGPGHHTILQYKGKYYIIYHRITDPKAAELRREICMDEMFFDSNGDIEKIVPTNKGVRNVFGQKK
jgi:beta-xylosidase